jgi:hypothetical protein
MRVWNMLAGALAMALLIAEPVAARCSTLHSQGAWVIVQDGNEVVEYVAESRRPGWQLDRITDEVVFCATCGQVRFSSSSDQNPLTLEKLRKTAHELGLASIDGLQAIELESLKGEAERFNLKSSTQDQLDVTVLEASDGCVSVVLLVQDKASFDQSRFRSPKAITEATALRRIPRGPISSFDIRCVKSRTIDDFAVFKDWAKVEHRQPQRNPPPAIPSHDVLMRGLQLRP